MLNATWSQVSDLNKISVSDLSAWSKNILWLFRNHNEVAVPALLAGQWPGPRRAREEGTDGHGGWICRVRCPVVAGGWVSVGVLACFTLLLLYSQGFILKTKTAKKEKAILII